MSLVEVVEKTVIARMGQVTDNLLNNQNLALFRVAVPPASDGSLGACFEYIGLGGREVGVLDLVVNRSEGRITAYLNDVPQGTTPLSDLVVIDESNFELSYRIEEGNPIQILAINGNPLVIDTEESRRVILSDNIVWPSMGDKSLRKVNVLGNYGEIELGDEVDGIYFSDCKTRGIRLIDGNDTDLVRASSIPKTFILDVGSLASKRRSKLANILRTNTDWVDEYLHANRNIVTARDRGPGKQFYVESVIAREAQRYLVDCGFGFKATLGASYGGGQ
ncbi:hypothetical protein HOC01_03925 [archaeon]|nr:hypothetical protein [archaeon]MBT6698440.1 hypothetical protein [archaeon]